MNKRSSVRQKQNILYPVVADQNVHKRDRNPRFPGPGRHNEKPSAMLLVQPFAKIGDRHALIRSAGNSRINFRVCNITAIPLLKHQLQLVDRMESHNLPIRIQAVNDLRNVTVRIIQDRFIAVDRLHTLAVQIHLMAPDFWGNARLLGFYNCKWLSISAIQDIIAEPNPLRIGHTVDFDFNTGFSGNSDVFGIKNVPTGFAQIEINIQAPSSRFTHIRRLMILLECAGLMCF